MEVFCHFIVFYAAQDFILVFIIVIAIVKLIKARKFFENLRVLNSRCFLTNYILILDESNKL